MAGFEPIWACWLEKDQSEAKAYTKWSIGLAWIALRFHPSRKKDWSKSQVDAHVNLCSPCSTRSPTRAFYFRFHYQFSLWCPQALAFYAWKRTALWSRRAAGASHLLAWASSPKTEEESNAWQQQEALLCSWLDLQGHESSQVHYRQCCSLLRHGISVHLSASVLRPTGALTSALTTGGLSRGQHINNHPPQLVPLAPSMGQDHFYHTWFSQEIAWPNQVKLLEPLFAS